ncbi:MAG: glycosyl hydrolase [Betaproteobacteria bacterium]|nr:glycosyl hydrolase [Betaproteobacteria bacterium]
MKSFLAFASLLLALSIPAFAEDKDVDAAKPKSPFSAANFKGIKLREIGPAVTSGRIIDIAVDPAHTSNWFVAVASGGVWKTINAGTTWTPVFDEQGSYSIGTVVLDPKNANVVWVGTGENNGQRSVGYGDGVYKSMDGGKTWKNLGLKASEHIGKIVIDPKNTDIVYVAAQGPLWSSGGDRGVYKTSDGGKTWTRSLTISEDTGASDLWMDPRDSRVLYATSWQRRRHVWGTVYGGPEGALWKSTDAGASWRKLETGIPKADLGRIGLAVSPANPDVVYALIEATETKDRGTYKSTDRGESWKRVGEYVPGGPMYYQELFPDPNNVDRVYSMDVFNQVTDDGGKTWKRLGEKYKHVDNHALWIDPANTDHLLNGNDGGVYESWDRAMSWQFKSNLPVTQFYRVAVDESKPFYNVYGGTQDNTTLGGPSRTRTKHGIVNSDWFVTTGGDGFFSAVDPLEPDIVYSESQYGVLVRFDRKTGEQVSIQPQEKPGEAPSHWNWDAPLMISPHANKRVYFASQRLYRSDDRGDNWTAISPDLTRQIDRNKLKMMGRVWSVDAVSKNQSTSLFGNIVSLTESPKVEGLLYVGTDDGLVQVSEDGGKAWRKVETFPGVPANSYVSSLKASPIDANTVYASFDNHKMGDFKPYLLKSADRGRSWVSITGDLPARGSVYTFAEDPTRAGLYYCGTEFGLFFSPDAGKRWVQLNGGMPIIAIKDMVIQAREGDLVLATFGRGFFVLDDLTPIRKATDELLAANAALMPVKDAWMFVPSAPLGLREKAFQGAAYYSAANPPFGAVLTYYLKKEHDSERKERLEQEKKIAAKKGDVFYPSWEALHKESREDEPAIVLTVRDAAGQVVRRITGPAKAGFTRVAWDLRFPPADPAKAKPSAKAEEEDADEEEEEQPEAAGPKREEAGEDDDNLFRSKPRGPLALPGTYTVGMELREDGKFKTMGEPVTFKVEILGTATLPAPDRAKVLAFAQKTARLQRAVMGAIEVAKDAKKRIDLLKSAIHDTPALPSATLGRLKAIENRLADIDLVLNGDHILAKYQEPFGPSIESRVQFIVQSLWTSTAAPTGTQIDNYKFAADAFAPLLQQLRSLLESDLKALESEAEAAGAPWTPGRVPSWMPE